MNEINLLPKWYAEAQARRRRRGRCVALIAFASLCLVGWFVAQHRQTAELRQATEAAEERLRLTQEAQTALARLRNEYSSLVKQVTLQQELAQPVTHTQVLAVLAKVLPEPVMLVEVRMQTGRPAPAAKLDPAKDGGKAGGGKAAPRRTPSKDEITIELVGLAPDDRTVAQVLGLLSEHPLFESVMLRHSRAIEARDAQLRSFRVTMRIDLTRQYKPVSPGAAGEVAHAG